MDVVLQSHEAKKVFPLPEGLKELSSDIVREVLRHQPECIHTFVAEYLETMLIVREKARDSALVVADVFSEAYFFENLYRAKNVGREEANEYATIIQAAWRGYVVRVKLQMYLQKKQKAEEERDMKKAMIIEEFLESIGITYDEATRAACLIQAAYKESKREKWVVNEFGEEVRMEDEDVPMGQRLREADIAHGRYDRWDKKDWGDFFNVNENGEIAYQWPRVGQLRRIRRKHIRPDMNIVQFFAMRDLQGKEQYSYLIEPQKGRDPRGFPIGFLIPLQSENLLENSCEVSFVNPMNSLKMGNYVYVFEKTVERQDLRQFAEVLTAGKTANDELFGELDYDPGWVLPKIMIQIRRDCLTEDDDEVHFVNETNAPQTNGVYTFRAENAETSLRVFNHLIKNKCKTVEDALENATNISEYKQRATGRFLAVEDFRSPKYIQKVVIMPETETAELEADDMDNYEYVFVPRKYRWRMRTPEPENPMMIPVTRFQGYHSDYLGSCGLEGSVFIMGPMMHSPDGKPFTFESLFWNEFGLESWYQLQCTISEKKIARLPQPMEEEAEETSIEYAEEEELLEKQSEKTAKIKSLSSSQEEMGELEMEDFMAPESVGDRKAEEHEQSTEANAQLRETPSQVEQLPTDELETKLEPEGAQLESEPEVDEEQPKQA